MRTTAAITIIIIIIISIMAFKGYSIIRTYSNSIEQTLTKIEVNVNKENWDKTGIFYDNLNDEWNRARRVFPILVDHQMLHDLEIAIARIESLLNQKERNKILSEISIAKRLINNIHEHEKPTIRNIF